MNINKIKSFTKERISNSKLALFVNLTVSLLINVLLIISLASNDISFVYIIFPILVAAFDVAYIIISIFTNYKFSYSKIYTASFSIAFILVSVAYAILLLDVLSAQRAVAITYVSFGFWAVSTVISIACILLGVKRAGKRSGTVSALLSILLVCLCVGAYSYQLANAGFFGQNNDKELRPVTFVYDEKNGYYVANGLVKGKGGSAVIPETFNGIKVGAVDLEILSADNLKTLTLTTDKVKFTNIDAVLNAPIEELTIEAPKARLSALISQIYTLADDNTYATDKLTLLAKQFTPNDLDNDEAIVVFQYSKSAIANAGKDFIPVWIGKLGDEFSFDYANSIDYVKNSKKGDETLLASLYNQKANGGGYILSELKEQDGSYIKGKRIVEKYTAVDVTFDKIYRLEIRSDNDTKYEIEDEFRYLDSSNKYRFVTVASSENLLGELNERDGFAISWKYSYSGSGKAQSFDNLKTLLTTIDASSVNIHPEWTLKDPYIDLCATENGSTGFTYGDSLKLVSAATAPINGIDLHYEWKLNGTTVATDSSFDITKINMYEQGSYVLEVTASSDTLTSLTSSAKSAVNITVSKKELPIRWIGFEGGNDFSITYSSESYDPEITFDENSLVFADDEITYKFNLPSIKDAGKHNVVISLTGDCDSKYYISQSNKKHEYTINKKTVELAWTDVDYTYRAEEIAPEVRIIDGICLGDDLTVSTSGQIITGDYKAQAVLGGAAKNNYDIKSEQLTYDYKIVPATLNIYWTEIEQVYTSKNLAPGAEVVGLCGDDTLDMLKLTVECSNAKNVGSYTATAKINNKNYVIADADQSTTMVITPAELTLSFSELTQVYAAAELRPSYEVSGKCQGDKESDLRITLTSAKNVGTHQISVTVGNPNYKLSAMSESVDLTITPKTVVVTWIANKVLVYNAEDQYLGIKTASGILNADNTKVKVEVDTDRSKNKTASDSEYTSYAILSGDEVIMANYVIDERTATANYTIRQKELTVEWGNASFTYDKQMHCPTARIISGICGDDIVNVTVEGSAINAVKKAVATASIDNANYVLKNPTKDFTINPKTLEITWSNLKFTYNGNTHKPTASINSGVIDGDTVEITVTGASTAGNHTASATISNANGNYSLSNPKQSFAIDKKEINIVWTDEGFIYDGKNQSPTAYVRENDVVPGDNVSISVTGAKDAGNHTATATTSNTNYSISDATAKYVFTIAPLTVDVSFSNTVKSYNGTAQLPDAVLVNKIKTDSVNLVFTVIGFDNGAINAGNYRISVSTSNTNYVLNSATTTLESFEILPRTLNVSWSNLTLVYNGSLQQPTAKLNNVVPGENVPFTVNGSGVSVGEYDATVSINNANYTLDEKTKKVTFEIIPLQVTVFWDTSYGSSFIKNGTAQSPEASATGVSLQYTYEKYDSTSGRFVAISGKPTEEGRYRVTVSTTSKNHTLSNQSLEFSIVAPIVND